MDFKQREPTFQLLKPILAKPFNEVDNFPLWAKKCIKKYVQSGTLVQVFKVSHAAMIYQSLWEYGVSPKEDRLFDAAKSVLYCLEKFNTARSAEEENQLHEDILANILWIREYFIINNCHDPYTSMVEVGKIWIEPEFSSKYYFDQLHAVIISHN